MACKYSHLSIEWGRVGQVGVGGRFLKGTCIYRLAKCSFFFNRMQIKSWAWNNSWTHGMFLCWVCGWNRKDWPFKWILLACTPSKIPSYSYHSKSYLRIISGSSWSKKWGSFWGKDCFRVDLGIISGLGSLFFRPGSFQVLCSCKVIN